jgi:O-succinylbenzoic acid--CoA ligase
MRQLSVVDVGDPRSLWEPLSAALFHAGPAVLPRPGGAKVSHTAPLEVPDDIALVIETSGTTGAPKRVALTAEAVLAGARITNDALGEGSWLLALPAHYIAGIQVCVRAHLGSTEPLFLHPDPFSATAVVNRVDEWEAAGNQGSMFISLVPAQLQRLTEEAAHMPRLHEVMQRWDAILVGGQALRPALAEQAREAGYRVMRTYGSSETAGGCVWDGVALPGVELRDIDGRIALSGPMLASGYLEDPERTAASFLDLEEKRWYVSDDSGEIDDAGRLRVLGRVDDVIISGGLKVSLASLERVLQARTVATDAVVVAQPDDTWGQVPVLVTITDPDLAETRALLAEALGPHARISRVAQVREIPLLSSGKPDRLAVLALIKGRS